MTPHEAPQPAPEPTRGLPAGQRFLCDAMLGRLARWLRAAGYDTTLAKGHEIDRDLVRAAIAEERFLLTLDRDFLEHRAARRHVLVLSGKDVSAQARELKRSAGIDWLFKPFTRCVVDNAPLRAADAGERATLPPRVRVRGGAVSACPLCARVYWSGDHHARMRDRLRTWARG